MSLNSLIRIFVSGFSFTEKGTNVAWTYLTARAKCIQVDIDLILSYRNLSKERLDFKLISSLKLAVPKKN